MILKKLALTPERERNIQWEDQFLTALAEGKVAVMSPDPIEGPDGWPYLVVTTEINDSDHNISEPTQKVIQWLSTRGIGLAVNPQKEAPDFILSYGMLWFFCSTGKFIQRHKATLSDTFIKEKVEYKASQLSHAGTPTEEYLPSHVRNILRDFFRDQNIFDARLLLLSKDKIKYDLAFSVESLGNPKESEWEGIGEAISWFLPLHYPIVIISEKGLPPFTNL